MDLDAILLKATEDDASDIHLKSGRPPTLRTNDRLYPIEGENDLTDEDLQGLVDKLLDDRHREEFHERHQVDLAYSHDAYGRFRVNVYIQRDKPAIALRYIPFKIRTIPELNLPPVIEKIAKNRRGLVLVTGTTGSGKSTTLASIIRYINESRAAHIITVEDPIEYVHTEARSIISQREVGQDVRTFAEGLRGALRQDPDVILVGEMRDLETIETAIMAAETGHLVLSTLHTLDATETLTRIIGSFPDHQRDQVRLILSGIMQGVVSQRLVPCSDGESRVPAVEVMVSTARIKECIAVKEKTPEIRDAISQGYTMYGMQTFDQSLLSLLQKDLITYEEALAQTTNPADFALKVRGVDSTSDSRWDDFQKDDTEEASEEDLGEGIKIERF